MKEFLALKSVAGSNRCQFSLDCLRLLCFYFQLIAIDLEFLGIHSSYNYLAKKVNNRILDYIQNDKFTPAENPYLLPGNFETSSSFNIFHSSLPHSCFRININILACPSCCCIIHNNKPCGLRYTIFSVTYATQPTLPNNQQHLHPVPTEM